jgi:hypothetical protein
VTTPDSPTGLEPDPHISEHAAAVGQTEYSDDTLSNRVESLRQTLAQLSPEVTKLQGQQKTVWSWLKGGAGFIAFDVIVTVLGVVMGFNLYSVEHQNDTLINQIRDQQVRLGVSIHETCNLYGTFLNFYSDAAKARFVGGPAQYDQLYLTLQTSADNLQCGIKHVVPGT